MKIAATYALLFLIAGILALSTASWTYAIRRIFGVRGSLDFGSHSRSPSHWGIIDLVLNALVYVLFSFFAAVVVRGTIPASAVVASSEPQVIATPSQAMLLLAVGVAQILSVIVGTILLWLRAGAGAVKAVWSFREFRADLSLALYAFGLVIVPVFIIQAVLTQLIKYEHPAITPFRESGDWLFFACAALTAVIAAPLGEEYFFRGLLQGWLERFALLGAANWEDLFAPKADPVRVTTVENEMGNAPDVVAPEFIANPYSFTSDHRKPAENLALVTVVEPPRPVPHWPLWVTSGIFALMHISQGAAPVPLFVFSIAMGYAYRHTGRILPSLIMHVMLNGFSMATLALSTLAPTK